MTHSVRIKVMQLDGNILQRIGIAIRLLRKGKGLTQLELSERCGVDRKFISSIECGTSNLSIQHLCNSCANLITMLPTLSGYKHNPPNPSRQFGAVLLQELG